MIRQQFKGILLLMLSIFTISVYGQTDMSNNLPPAKPVKLKVAIDLYKVYDISTVDESFKIDGYFSYSWSDPRMAFDSAEQGTKKFIYTNERLEDFLTGDMWFPEMEIINSLGTREVDNKALTIHFNGRIQYVERFRTTLKEELEYHRFPFDQQELKIEIEPFAYDMEDVVIESLTFKQAVEGDSIQTEDWLIVGRSASYGLVKESVENIGAKKSKNEIEIDASMKEYAKRFSHAEGILIVKRMPGYYLWQLIFPLLVIMLTSIVILWIEDYVVQIELGFTLLLTIVAFNFFSETILPKLPYNTFIEVLIMIGYIFVLISIITVVYKHRLSKSNHEKGLRVKRLFKIYYPIALMLSIFLSSVLYFGTWVFDSIKAALH
jgi:hypothetical protein